MIMWSLLVCLCAAVACVASQSVESRVVTTNHGPVRGYKDADGSMFSFYDVPYATAPRGRDKFKAPLPPPVWTEPFEAVHRSIGCPQRHDVYPQVNVQEDCLVANIFVPNTDATNLSVVVNVHAGGFTVGYSGFIELKNFVKSNNMILVSFNYRLLAYGFLCLGTENVPGNAGLKDQVALLRWVNQNIAKFGGNPDDVTIMGCSAGGISVDILTLSSMTNGLFHRAIADSGCSYGAIGAQPDPIKNAKEYARILNFTNVDDLKALEEFYITTPYEELVSQQVLAMERIDSGLLFGPCVERDVGVEMFLTDDPVNILKSGNFSAINMIYGLANKEGLFKMSNFYEWSDMMNRNFSDFLPSELKFENDEEKDKVAKTIKSFYFGNEPVGPSTVIGYIDFFTDVIFGYRMMKIFTSRLAAKQQNIYLYEYSFVDANSPLIPYTENGKGANHCDQMFAVFDEDETEATEEYKNMKQIMRAMWMNFILTGNPTPEGSDLVLWPTANITRSPYMSLGNIIELKNALFEERFKLWDDIYEKYYQVAMPPTPNIPDGVGSFTSNVFIICFVVILNIVPRYLLFY